MLGTQQSNNVRNCIIYVLCIYYVYHIQWWLGGLKCYLSMNKDHNEWGEDGALPRGTRGEGGGGRNNCMQISGLYKWTRYLHGEGRDETEGLPPPLHGPDSWHSYNMHFHCAVCSCMHYSYAPIPYQIFQPLSLSILTAKYNKQLG